ncbi:MAG: methylated-DNA--[protein]-cysteine S-methyltransferase [Ruminococcaceae bacterium]|nr:methylated-DNA--[protein]-cysteine S-methyltransferase [Oscillospiraceae bacterium]
MPEPSNSKTTTAANQQAFELKPLRLADAAELRRLGIYTGTLKEVSDQIRILLNRNEKGGFLISGGTADLPVSGLVSLLPDAFRPEVGRLTILGSNLIILPQLLAKVSRIAFTEQKFLRLEALVPESPELQLRAYRQAGFRTDSIITDDISRLRQETGFHQLSLAKTSNRHPAVGLVPYKYGIMSVKGTETEIEAVDFQIFGESVTDSYIEDVFRMWGLLDEDDKLLVADTCLKLIRNDNLPVMVGKAVKELDEYFSGLRQEFDLTVNLDQGSAFQQAVWAALQTIPYGTTETYLDIAMKLTYGDRKRAHTLSRAVGGACGANPVAIVVPCHRVIGHDGRLTGFSGGVKNKEFLLHHELFGSI